MPVINFLISFFIEFSPNIAFFLATVNSDFFTGVKFLLVFTVISFTLSAIRDKRIPIFMALSSFFVVTFGILTLYFWTPYFTVLEYTLYNLFFCLGVVVGYFKKKPAMKILFNTMFSITDYGWHILSIRWGIVFFLAAVGNEISWNFYGEKVWIYYRFIAAILLAIFGFSQFFLAKRERLVHASPWGLKIHKK